MQNHCDCKIIGADLPYMHAVSKPSIVVDPASEESIFKAFEEVVKTEVLPSKRKFLKTGISHIYSFTVQSAIR